MLTTADLHDIDFSRISIPTLTGTEKQIEWAKKIRAEAAHILKRYALTRNSRGNPSDIRSIASKGLAEMVKYTNDAASIYADDIQPQVIDRTVAGFLDLEKRITRLREILSHSEASWWIENRPNDLPNHLYKKFYEYLDN